MIYRITKAIHGNKNDMAVVFRPVAGFGLGRMRRNTTSSTTIARTVKFFKEIGHGCPKRNPGT